MLNNLFTPKNKKKDINYFLAIEIHEAMIKTALWQIEEDTPSVVNLGSYELWDSEDSLINGVDASITEATKNLGQQPDRVIFGLPDSWLVGDKIHASKQRPLKKLIDTLSLKAIGLVTISEAIIQHLKTQEGVPPTAILLEIYSSKVAVSLVNLGHIQTMEEVARSDDLAADVEEGLSRFEADKLPSRFILTNGSDLEAEEQILTSYPWMEKLPFVHLPKVQTLSIDFSIKAIALSGGAEAARSVGVSVVTPEESVEDLPKEDPIADTTDLSSLGFVVENENLQEVSAVEPADIEVQPETPEEVTEVKTKPKKQFSLPQFKLPSFSLPNVGLPLYAKLALPVVFLALVVGGISGFYFFFGQATIYLTVDPQRINKSVDLALAMDSTDGADIYIKGAKKTLSATVSDSMNTTGEAVVGEKAKGRVTIYNFSAEAVNLKSGTRLTAANANQVFVLDTAVTIASRSAQTEPPFTITPGSASLDVTAGRIGAELNLEKGTQFGVDTYPKSVLLASSDNNFTGGTSRTVKAVDKTDVDNLLTQATNKIKEEINTKLQEEDVDSRSVALSEIKFTSKKFSNAVGEEAGDLGLELAGDVEVFVYSNLEAVDNLKDKVLADGDAGMEIVPEKTEITITNSSTTPDKNGLYLAKANIDAVLLPQIDEAKISELAKGKSIPKLKEILERIRGYESGRIQIRPQIPLLENYLPLKTENIKIYVSIK